MSKKRTIRRAKERNKTQRYMKWLHTRHTAVENEATLGRMKELRRDIIREFAHGLAEKLAKAWDEEQFLDFLVISDILKVLGYQVLPGDRGDEFRIISPLEVDFNLETG